MQISLAALADPLNAELVGTDVTIGRAVTDSREARPGDLFVPLIAERDGHQFLSAAVANGAAATLWARDPESLKMEGDVGALVVADTGVALNDLARFARSRTAARVTGITGSVGKTTVKDLVAEVLGSTLRVSASERSFNNEIGVPLTICNAPDDTEALVVEMGARGPGHVAALCELARPQVGVVTVVAGAHIECFGDLAGVAAAKGELIAALPADGTAVLNADDPLVAAMAGRSAAKVLTFGRGSADVRASQVALGADLRATFVLESPWGTAEVRMSIAGEHHVINALAAAAVGLDAGVPVEKVAAALGSAGMSPWRMEMAVNAQGATIINDAYNANPTSTNAALTALASLPARRRVAVLGEMAELGPDSTALHREVAERAHEMGIEVLAVGTADYGVEPCGIEQAIEVLEALATDEAALVKGSRVAELERLVQRVAQPAAADPGCR